MGSSHGEESEETASADNSVKVFLFFKKGVIYHLSYDTVPSQSSISRSGALVQEGKTKYFKIRGK
jgi:hypothetical protein